MRPRGSRPLRSPSGACELDGLRLTLVEGGQAVGLVDRARSFGEEGALTVLVAEVPTVSSRPPGEGNERSA